LNFFFIDYISIELELDIDIERYFKLKIFVIYNLNPTTKVFNKIQFYISSDSLGTKRNIEELNINSCENNGKYFI
jgi:hypothetical protein